MIIFIVLQKQNKQDETQTEKIIKTLLEIFRFFGFQ